jgi:hypothetical protein
MDFAYARLNQMSVDRQSNCLRRSVRTDHKCEMPCGTILTRQQKVVFHADLPIEGKASSGDEAVKITLNGVRFVVDIVAAQNANKKISASLVVAEIFPRSNSVLG